MGVRLGKTTEVGNALTVKTRLAGESVDAGNFQTGLQVNANCGNGGACIGGDTVVLQAGTSDGSQALTLDGTVQGESVVNLRPGGVDARSEEHTSELQSLMRLSYAVFCLTKKK